jgi:hypothetical protein
MPRNPNDTQINFPVTQDEMTDLQDRAAGQSPPLSVVNYLRSRLGLPLRQAGGRRVAGEGPTATKKPSKKKKK